MAERDAGQRTWSLSPYEVNVSFAAATAPGDGAGWFGPSTPIKPLAPPEIAGRQWDFPAGYNLSTVSRPYEPVTFATLRALADGYDLLRLVIETRKDQVARHAWTIKPREGAMPSASASERIEAARQFFARPDGTHGFADWLRILLEEVLVTDAPALYMSRERSGRLRALMPLDGTTIKPILDLWGRTPQPHSEGGKIVYPPAYQQILKGYPAIEYSIRDLVYRPRNLRVNRAYGFSPVEQIVTTVNIALRRQMFLLDYFTEGNIPDSLIGVPEGWTPDQIATYQKYWDAYFDGDQGRRRRAKFVPGGVAKTFVQTSEPELKGAFDEWLARIVCFALSVSPQALTQTMNRATAETQKDLSEEEGLAPILGWVKGLVDDVLSTELDGFDLEFCWCTDKHLDPVAQERMLSNYTTNGILSINEARAEIGLAPFSEASADRPMTLSGTGYVPLPDQAEVPDVPARRHHRIR